MSSPTQDQIQTQWKNAVDLLEKHRVYADAVVAASGELDVLTQSIHGTYTPAGLADAANTFRAAMATAITQSQALAFFEPLVFEYAKFINDNTGSGTGFDAGSTDIGELMQVIYDHMENSSELVESRAISFQSWGLVTTSNGFTGSIVGTGQILRLTQDRHDNPIEAVHVERKVFKCTADQTSGTKEEAELFEAIGEAPSPDGLGFNAEPADGLLGSGATIGKVAIRALNAGTGPGGSLLRNSSFSDYAIANTPASFTGWDFTGTTEPTQDTGGVALTDYYRSHPGATTNASLRFIENAKMTQTLANMRVSSLQPGTPYFFRVMYNRAVGSGDGTLSIRIGSKTAEVILSAQTGWNELRIGDETLAGTLSVENETDQWFENFTQDGFDIEIELSNWSTGTVLIDDAILAPYTLYDGTYYAIRQVHATAPVPWKLEDTVEITDDGGDPETGKMQYWLFRAGLGYLPSATTGATWTDP